MTIADIVEREYLARRAPRPVSASFSPFLRGEGWEWMGSHYESFMRYGSIHIRMSDGSLVIVRRKNR